MKDLLEIHNEIKNLEALIKLMSASINGSDDEQEKLIRLRKLSIELSDDIKTVNKDIKDLQEKSKQEYTICDYDVISALAHEIPFKHHPLEKLKDHYLCKLYIGLLVNIARLGRDRDFDLMQMGFIQWILNKSAFDESMENIVRDCYAFDKGEINNIKEYLSDKYKENLLIDALIIVNINGKCNRNALEFISDLCVIFELEAEADVFAIIANIALSQNIQALNREQLARTLPYLDNVNNYINSDIVNKILIAQREIILELPDSKITEEWDGKLNFKWKVKQQGEYVIKGEAIATYQDKVMKEQSEAKRDMTHNIFSSIPFMGISGYSRPSIPWTNIKTKSFGYIFFFSEKKVKYAVISHKDDDREEIRKWIRGENK